ncbi:MAG: inorganic phosphate transporter, partial [Anaerolineaceae bacterium]
TLWISIPSSSTHSLVGGIFGAVIAAGGLAALQTGGIIRILLSLFLSPVLGIAAGFLLTLLFYYLARNATPNVNEVFMALQVPFSVLLATSYGANDAQKTMAMITLSLIAVGRLDTFDVPTWVILISAGATAVGILLSDQRLVHKLGSKFFRLKPIHGAGAEAGASIILLGSSLLGYPASSSQVITSAILGSGAADRVNKVRWGIAGQILQAWLVAIPVSMLLAAACYWLLGLLPIHY